MKFDSDNEKKYCIFNTNNECLFELKSPRKPRKMAF